MNGLHVVSLYGSWYEMGRQYGALMRDELAEVHLFVESIIEYSFGNAEKAKSIISVQTAQTPYRISEFFRGASETCGLTVEQLQAVNAVERIGGAMNELTVFQMVMIPEKSTLWLRVIGGGGWTQIDLSSFLS